MSQTQGRVASLTRDVGVGFSVLAVLMAMFLSAAYRRFGEPSTPPAAVMQSMKQAVQQQQNETAPPSEDGIRMAQVPAKERSLPPVPESTDFQPNPARPVGVFSPAVTPPPPGVDLQPIPARDVPAPLDVPPSSGGDFSIEAAEPIPTTGEFDSTSQTLPSITATIGKSISGTATTGAPVVALRRAEPTAIIRQGDSHWTIAQRVYGDGNFFRALYEYNRADFPHPDALPAGRSVTVPPPERLRQLYPQICPRAVSSVAQVSFTTADQGRSSLAARNYTVQSGESLFDIARFQLGQASRYVEIIRLNPGRLTGQQTGPLREGLQLRLPVQ